MIECMAALRGLTTARFSAPELREELVENAYARIGEKIWKQNGSAEQHLIDCQGMIDGFVGLASSKHQPAKATQVVDTMSKAIISKTHLLNYRQKIDLLYGLTSLDPSKL